MKKRLTVAVLGSVAATALLSAFRIFTLPQVQQTVGGTYPPLWALATAVLLAGVLLCGRRRYEDCVAIRPAAARAIGAGAIAAGALLIMSSLVPLKAWLDSQILPYPVNGSLTAADPVLFYLLVAFGTLGGLSLLWFGINGMLGRPVSCRVARVLMLFPLAWSWIRILRYELSHISTLQIAKHWPDVLLLVAEMLFLLTFVKLVAFPGQKPGRFAAGVALCAGVCATVGSVLRGYLALTMGEQTTAIAGLVTAADLGIAVLAFASAFALLSADTFAEAAAPEEEPLPVAEPLPTETEEPPSDPLPEAEEDEEDNAEPLMLITDEAFLTAPQEDEAVEETEESCGPLELEDVIDNILKNLADGEK